MRTMGLLLSGLFLLGMCRADDAPQDTKQTERLTDILDQWEKATKSVREMHYRFKQTEENRFFQSKTVRTGQVFFKKPELLRIDTTEPDGKKLYLLLKERTIHYFPPDEKTEYTVALSKEYGFPENPNKYPQNTSLEKLGGGILEWIAFVYLQPPLRAMQADGRLQLTKEDQNWIYLEWEPRAERFRADFRRCMVVLDVRTYRVRMLWYEQPNGNTIRFDVENLDTNPKPAITGESILKGLPQDFEQKKIQELVPPFLK